MADRRGHSPLGVADRASAPSPVKCSPRAEGVTAFDRGTREKLAHLHTCEPVAPDMGSERESAIPAGPSKHVNNPVEARLRALRGWQEVFNQEFPSTPAGSLAEAA